MTQSSPSTELSSDDSDRFRDIKRPQTQTSGHPLRRVAGHRRRGEPSPVHQSHRLPTGVGRGPVRQLHRAVQRHRRRRACPIRFQCAGCGFYRPDPSYLPALEQHIADLRADRETARSIGAADYVQANLTAEIDAFARVAEQMRHRLADLGSDERAEVEQASRLLRRARAGRRLPLTVNPAPSTQTG